MAYMSTEHAARIRADLKDAFPARDGWKLSVAKSDSNGIDVAILAGPVEFVAWDFDAYARDDTARTMQEAKERGATRVVTAGQVNEYWHHEHFTPESSAVLARLIGIVAKEHWDKSDIQTDYFHCAFYMHFQIGRWGKPYVRTREMVAA
jgi:Large polyvalent protein associated domain 29